MGMFDPTYIQAREDAIKARITAIEGALLAFGDHSIQSYTMDTGQSRQVVTRMDIKRLQDMLDAAMNQLAILEARRTGAGTMLGRGSW